MHQLIRTSLPCLLLAACTLAPSSPAGGGDQPDGGGSGGKGDGPGGGTAPAGFVFSAYKDTSINLDWNTNVVSTMVPGARTALVTDLTASGAKAISLAFATGECGSENWGGVPGAAMAAANASSLASAGIDYVLSTGGAAGSFTCGSDAGFAAFIQRWTSPHLVGIDFDIEAGQSQAVIQALIARIAPAHAAFPGLRFSLTLATLANTDGADSLNTYGSTTLAALRSAFGTTWPSYVTVNLMTMDYGAPAPGVCVVASGSCDMGRSAIQAANNLHDRYGVPLANIELTPMIGGNDVQSEHFTLQDVDTVVQFALDTKLAGYHYWSYDRDVDCPPGSASPTCNSLGGVGSHGFLQRALADGLR